MSEFAVRCGWSDGVSCSSFARHSYTLAVSSWDSTLKIISAADNKLLNSIAHSAPVLTCQFGSEDSKVYSGGLDRRVLSTDLGHDAVPMALGSHKAPVKNIVVEEHQIISGSWDASIKVWDERQKLETKSIDLSGKVFALDARSGKVVVGTSDGKIFIFDARNMSEPEQVRDSPLKHQMRCIRISPNGEWFAIGSIEGRVAVEFFNVSEAIQAKKYAFKCHRSTLEGVATAYPVNALAFHPMYCAFLERVLICIDMELLLPEDVMALLMFGMEFIASESLSFLDIQLASLRLTSVSMELYWQLHLHILLNKEKKQSKDLT
jgi:cell cycle arrest protein BUB3